MWNSNGWNDNGYGKNLSRKLLFSHVKLMYVCLNVFLAKMYREQLPLFCALLASNTQAHFVSADCNDALLNQHFSWSVCLQGIHIALVWIVSYICIRSARFTKAALHVCFFWQRCIGCTCNSFTHPWQVIHKHTLCLQSVMMHYEIWLFDEFIFIKEFTSLWCWSSNCRNKNITMQLKF